MLNEIFVRIESNHISFGGTCKVSELPEHFEKLRKVLEDSDEKPEEDEEKPEPKKKGFGFSGLSLKKR